MNWVDTHAHLDDARFQDLPAVLRRATEAGVVSVLTIGVDVATSRAAIQLAEAHQEVFAVVGIQPNHVSEADADDFTSIEQMATHPRVVAIGESGLDRYWDRAPFPLQEVYFNKHLDLARRVHKPIIIHCREAEADVVRMLRLAHDAHGPIAGVMHSFSGDLTTAEACVSLGLHISFAGMLTYKTAENLREAARALPLDRLLVETDAPYLAPVPHRGKRNEPAFVIHTAAMLAECQGVSLEVLAESTTANAKRLFSL